MDGNLSIPLKGLPHRLLEKKTGNTQKRANCARPPGKRHSHSSKKRSPPLKMISGRIVSWGCLRQGAPTKRTTCFKNSSEQCWEPTTLITVQDYDTLQRWPVWPEALEMGQCQTISANLIQKPGVFLS